MKVVVLVKETPDSEAIIKTGNDGKIDDSAIEFVVNPYDEFAIEEALKIKEGGGASEVVLLSFGPQRVKDRLLRGLAMGADRAVLIDSGDIHTTDSLTNATVLAGWLKTQEDIKIVLCGKQAIDDDNMHVGMMVAELMSWPHANVVSKVDLADNTITAEREVEGGQCEVYRMTLPAVVGAHKSLNTPRYASLPGIMKAKKKPFDSVALSDVGFDGAELKSLQKTAVVGFSSPPEKPAGQTIADGTSDEKAAKLIKLLREEAKSI